MQNELKAVETQKIKSYLLRILAQTGLRCPNAAWCRFSDELASFIVEFPAAEPENDRTSNKVRKEAAGKIKKWRARVNMLSSALTEVEVRDSIHGSAASN